jgi:methionyl-tRNA formyltransferase
MRVVVIGQAAFGEAVLKRLIEDGHEVAAVSAPAPTGGRADPLWAAAESAGIPAVATEELRTPEGVERWRSFAPELAVMAFVTAILPEEVFAIPAKGTIQYHPSLLPKHRGSSAINWAIIFGENVTGLTIFWPDKGIDTGPILLQEAVEIAPDDTVGSLYFQKLFPMGVDAVSRAVRMVEEGTAPRIPQNHAETTYEPPCTEEHGRILWFEPAERVYARIRGCNPQPGAWTEFEGARLRIFDCRLERRLEPGMPGRVLEVAEDGFTVRLNGGVLRVLRVQPPEGPKVNAGEWARSAGLRAGYRFRP